MGKMGLRDTGTDTYVYQEITGGNSVALGLDNSDSDNFKFVINAAAGATPSGTAKWVMRSSGARTIPLQPLFIADFNNEANASGDGTVHFIGSIAAMNEILDVAGNFFPGNGAGTGASFTAPVDGIYLFNYGISVAAGVGGANSMRNLLVSSSGTSINCGNWPTLNTIPNYRAAGNDITWAASSFVPMTAGDNVRFAYIGAGGAKTDTVYGINSVQATASFISGALYD